MSGWLPSVSSRPGRVLHVVTLPDGGYDQALAVGTLQAAEPGRHELLAVGPAGTRGQLAALGVHPEKVLTPLLGQVIGRASLAASGLRAFLRERGDTRYGLVHCWSVEGGDLATRVIARGVPVVCTPVRGPRGRADLCAVVDGTLAPLVGEWEVGADVPESIPLPRVNPGSEVERRAARASLRERLGISAGELCVLMLADVACEASARQFASQSGVMRLAGIGSVGLVPRGAGQGRRGVRHTARHEHAWDLIYTEWPSAALSPAADLAIWSRPMTRAGAEAPGMGGVLSAHRAAADGIPVVGLDAPIERAVVGAAAPFTLTRDLTLPSVAKVLVGLTQHAAEKRDELEAVGRLLRAAAEENSGDFAGCITRLHERAFARGLRRGGGLLAAV